MIHPHLSDTKFFLLCEASPLFLSGTAKLLRKRLERLVFQYETGIDVDEQYQEELIRINNQLPEYSWHRVRNGFKVWKRKDGQIIKTLNGF